MSRNAVSTSATWFGNPPPMYCSNCCSVTGVQCQVSSNACIWAPAPLLDRKSTRLNSSHSQISYAVFCLTKQSNGQDDDPSVPAALLQQDHGRQQVHHTHPKLPLQGALVNPYATTIPPDSRPTWSAACSA